MSFEWRVSPIAGVRRTTIAVRDDVRGTFRELWRDSWTRPLGLPPFVQANLSRSDAGVLRGLHYHLRQADLWVVLEGSAHVCLVDIRDRLAGGSSMPHVVTEVLDASQAVLIPEGVAHGFWALDPVSLLYVVTNEYDGTDEHGFRWDDPSVASAWPAGEPTLSDRDATAPSLAEAIAAVQRSGQTSGR